MNIFQAGLESISPYSQSRHYETPKLDKESADAYEKRTWMERLHVSEDGHVFIPPMAFKNCLSDAAKFLGMKVPDKAKATYTKHFEAGVLIMDPLPLPETKEQVQGEWLFVPSNGRRGGGSRVLKCFPYIPAWKGEVTIYILDNTITEEALRYHLDGAGKFIGIGRFRPRNNGFYGRFKVTSLNLVGEK